VKEDAATFVADHFRGVSTYAATTLAPRPRERNHTMGRDLRR
jgi:hypothetical protein